MNVYMIEGDGAFYGMTEPDVSQSRAISANDRHDRPVRGITEIAALFHGGAEREEPVLTDFGHPPSSVTLLMRRPGTDVVRPMLQENGIILPVSPSWKGHAFELFICERKIDAIDPDRMKYVSPEEDYYPTDIRSYAFRPEMVADATVFRAEGLLNRLFATDRFIDLVQANGLTGLKILPLWSSDTGSLVTFEDPYDEFQIHPPKPGNTGKEKRARMRAILAARDAQPPA